MTLHSFKQKAKFVIPAVAAMLAIGATASAAWTHASYLDKPVSPQSLPGDNLPPFGMLDANGKVTPQPTRPPGAPPMHARERESNAVGPSLLVSIAGAQAAIAECRRLGAYGAATVVDTQGDARAMLSADGADGSHVFVAQRKAITALEFEMPGIKVKEMALAGDPKILSRVTPNMFVQFGGYPITQKGKVIGAIGYSGGIDEPCAIAGLKEIEKRLGEPAPKIAEPATKS
jgi:uncharacterized protein GlcG (DUF336 family)